MLPAATTTTTPERTRRSTSTHNGLCPHANQLGLEVVADAHVDAVDPDVAAVAVDLLDLLARGDEVAHRPFAVLVQDLEADQLARRRHARDGFDLGVVVDHLAPLVLAVDGRFDADLDVLVVPLVQPLAQRTGDNAGDVRAVARLVDQRGPLQLVLAELAKRREVAMSERRGQLEIPVCPKMRVARLDTGIQDRPHDVVAEGTERVAGGVGLDRGERAVGHARHHEIRPDAIERRLALLGGGGALGPFAIRPHQLLDQVAA